jgi:hypothetical protein
MAATAPKPSEPPRGRWTATRDRLQAVSPLVRGLAGLVGFAATLIGLLLGLGVVHPLGGGGDVSVAEAATRSVHAGTSQLFLRVAVSNAPGGPVRFSAQGAFDYRSGDGRLSYDFADTPGLQGFGRVDARFAGGTAYVRLPAAIAPAGRTWVEVDTAKVDKILDDLAAAGQVPAQAPQLRSVADVSLGDPSQVLTQLRRGGPVHSVGEQTIFGVRVHGYRGVLRPQGGGAPVQTVAWIGTSDGLIRRLELSGNGRGGQVATTFDFSNYGTRVSAGPPPADRVTPLSTLIAGLAAR